MKVGMYYNNNDVRVEEVSVPKISDNEILVKVIASGICGSDVMEWYRIKKAPLVLGHEIAGDIVEVGKNVKGCKKGDRVFVSHHVPCGVCKYCLNGNHTTCDTLHNTNFDPGGFAEFVRIPEINTQKGILKLPEKVTYEEGTFIEPLGCVLRGQRKTGIKSGQTILILGSGISGILHLMIAKLLGAKKVIMTDIDESRLKLAKKFGASHVINAKDELIPRIKEINNNMLCDVVIVCAGALSAFEQALNSVDKGGTVLFYAPAKPGETLDFNVLEFWKKEVTLVPSYAAASYDLKSALDLIIKKKVRVDDLITHKLSLDEIAKGFKLVTEAKNSLKVIIYPNK